MNGLRLSNEATRVGSMAYGPMSDRYHGNRGAIAPSHTWRFRGESGDHEIRVDSGRLGYGPFHVRIDGWRVFEAPKPSKRHPWLLSPPMLVDGPVVTVFAGSRNHGISIEVDVFVDGRSLVDGRPLGELTDRTRAIEAASAAFVSEYDSVKLARGTLETASVLVFMTAAPVLTSARSWPRAVLVYAAFAAVVLAMVQVLRSVTARMTPRTPHRRAAAALIIVITIVVYLGSLIILMGFGLR